MDTKSKFQEAYETCGLTKVAVAALTNLSRPSLDKKLAAPDKFTLNEYCIVWRELDEEGKEKLDEFLEDLKAKNFDYELCKM